MSLGGILQCEIRFIIYSPVMNNSVSDSYSNFTGVLQKKKACKMYVLFRQSIHFPSQHLPRFADAFEAPVGVLP